METYKVPVCTKCGMPVRIGQVVVQQGGPHILCDDPYIDHHQRLMRPPQNPRDHFEIGYVDDQGKEIWL